MNLKKASQEPRARAKEKAQVPQYVAKVYKKAAQIADLMTGEDVEADLKVLRDAKKACHHVYDTKKKKLKKVPDHKTRLAATTLPGLITKESRSRSRSAFRPTRKTSPKWSSYFILHLHSSKTNSPNKR